jgi:iron complex transport system ATP-binding protein
MTGLDNGYQQKLLAQLAALARDGCGVLVNTHDPEHALQVASSVAVLARGRIAADGPPLEIVTAEMIEDARGVRRLLPPTRAAN